MTAIEWNKAQLQEYLWGRLGARKHGVGRPFVDNAVTRLIAHWPFVEPTESLPKATAPEFGRLSSTVSEEMRGYGNYRRKYGFVWAIVLSAVVSQLVKLLIEWWLERRENRTAMSCMKIAFWSKYQR